MIELPVDWKKANEDEKYLLKNLWHLLGPDKWLNMKECLQVVSTEQALFYQKLRDEKASTRRDESVFVVTNTIEGYSIWGYWPSFACGIVLFGAGFVLGKLL